MNWWVSICETVAWYFKRAEPQRADHESVNAAWKQYSEQLKQELIDQWGRIDHLRNDIDRLDEEERQCQDRVRKMQQRLSSMEMDLESCKTVISRTESKVVDVLTKLPNIIE